MGYTKELYEGEWLGVYWDGTAPFFDRYSWMPQNWPCGCVWLVFWKLKINILYKEQDVDVGNDDA